MSFHIEIELRLAIKPGTIVQCSMISQLNFERFTQNKRERNKRRARITMMVEMEREWRKGEKKVVWRVSVSEKWWMFTTQFSTSKAVEIPFPHGISCEFDKFMGVVYDEVVLIRSNTFIPFHPVQLILVESSIALFVVFATLKKCCWRPQEPSRLWRLWW